MIARLTAAETPEAKTAWLIERAGQWYAAAPHSRWGEQQAIDANTWRENWTSDANKALRFARKCDAETLIRYESLQNAVATEHVWLEREEWPDLRDPRNIRRALRQAQDNLERAAASPAPPPPSDVVEEIARIIDPAAFGLVVDSYRGDPFDKDRALAKARQIAALQGSEGGHAGMNAIAPGVVATNAFNLSFALCHGLPFLSMVTHAERVAALEAKLNTPELHDFSRAIVLEAAHQRERWGAAHDHGKAPEDWFWLLGYLGGKALSAAKTGDTAKALHHTISTAAALANWHAALLGASTIMRPGIDPVERGLADAHEG